MDIKNIKVNYDVECKEVQAISVIRKTSGEKVAETVRAVLHSLWKVKFGLFLGAWAGVAVAQIVAVPIALGGMAGASVGAMAWRIMQAIRAPSCPLAKLQSLPLEFSFWKLREAKRVNRIMLKLLDTTWGKQWQAIKNFKLNEAFENTYRKLLKGTCLGQTHALLKMMSSSHAKPSKELIDQMYQEDALRYQIAHNMRITLFKWRDEDFKKLGLCVREEDLRSHHAKVNQVQLAQLDAFRDENDIPKAERKDDVVLSHKLATAKVFRNTLQNRLEALERDNPGKVIAGSMGFKLKKDGGHAFFVQCNGGHFRLYDINHGMYSYGNQDRLVRGIYNHLKGYGPRGIDSAVMKLYAIKAA